MSRHTSPGGAAVPDVAESRFWEMLSDAEMATRHPASATQEVIDHALSLLEDAYRTLRKKVQHKTALLKSRQNDHSTLSRFPTEVLTYILLHTIEFDSWTVAHTKTIASVCRYWFDIVLSSGEFFPGLDMKEPLDTTKFILRQNKIFDLDVKCGDFSGSDAERFLEVASAHAARWRSFHFNGQVYRDPNVDTPHLVELAIVNRESGIDEPFPSFGLTGGSPLQALHLYHAAVPWGSPRLRGLTSIRLHRLRQDVPSVIQLHHMLVASPNLQHLCLCAWYDVHAGGQDSGQPDPNIFVISLPHLSFLLLEDLPDPYMDHLLATISAPACSTIGLCCRRSRQLRHSRFVTLITPIIHRSNKCFQMVFDTGDESLNLSSPFLDLPNYPTDKLPDTPGYCLRFKGEKLLDMRPALLEFVHSTRLAWRRACTLTIWGNPPVSVAAEGALPVSSFPLEFLHDWPSVRSFQFQHRFQGLPVMQYLEKPRLVNGRKVWVCPELRRLDLKPLDTTTEDEIVNDILNFLRVRNSRNWIPKVLAINLGVIIVRLCGKDEDPKDLYRDHVWMIVARRSVVVKLKQLGSAYSFRTLQED